MTSRACLPWSLLLLVSVAACVGDGGDAGGGSSGSSGGSGGSAGSSGSSGSGGTSGSGGSLGCSSAAHCGGGGFVCGVHSVASCGEVDCGACRFRADGVGTGDITAAPDRSIHLAYVEPSDRQLLYAVPRAEGLETEAIVTEVRVSEVAIAVASDGAVHVVYVDDSDQVMHAVRPAAASPWEVALADMNGEEVDVALDADDAVHILVTGEDPVTRARQVRHITRDGSTYTATALDLGMAIGKAVVGRGENGAIALVVRSDLMELAAFDLVDGVFVRDTSLPELDDQPAEWSVTVGIEGRLRILALLGNYTLRTGSQLVLATREAGTWNVEAAGGVAAQVTRGIGLASGPLETQHVAYYARRADGLFYTRPGSTVRLNVDPECDEGDVRMAIDANDQPHILHVCDSGTPQYIAPIARYSEDYIAACEQGANLICDRACDCGAPDCCYNDGTADGSNGCTFGPGGVGRDICVADFKVRLCGRLSVDEAPLLDACKPALESTAPMCLGVGYSVPDACWPVINASYR